MPSVIPRIQAALAPTLGFLLDREFERLLARNSYVRVGAASGAGSSRSL